MSHYSQNDSCHRAPDSRCHRLHEPGWPAPRASPKSRPLWSPGSQPGSLHEGVPVPSGTGDCRLQPSKSLSVRQPTSSCPSKLPFWNPALASITGSQNFLSSTSTVTRLLSNPENGNALISFHQKYKQANHKRGLTEKSFMYSFIHSVN